ncbi:methyltransferase [Phenylobacterium sp.]|uniref:methyltransferase n=1 Tax=Phenylobacterium sp. TaxID=1871053 RepID=UPI002CEA1614|nr:methyltransferase [Phenylobacterium sp.]HLZ74945.1 methyltransferase [Phenylobacterium sp.]
MSVSQQVNSEALQPPSATAAEASESAEITDLTRHGLRRFAAGDVEQASRIFTALVGGWPEHALSWNLHAMALTGLERREEAIAALRRSLDIDANQAEVWASLASSLAQLQRWDDADAAGEAAVALAGESAEIWQIRANGRTARNDFRGASEALAAAADLDPDNAALRANLGAALLKCGRFPEADAAFARALDLDPESGPIAEGKRLCAVIVGALRDASAETLVRVCAGADADVDRLFKTALLLLGAGDQADAAARVAEAWVERRPDCVEALYFRDAQSSRGAARPPAALVRQQFDDAAETFDQHLVGQLAYDGPSQLAALIAACEARQGQLETLDLGCGTGLCGEVLRPYAKRLVGIDLSGGMLAKARERALYDRLEEGDAIEVMLTLGERWDLIVAFDTLPYLGGLESLFEVVAAVLRPGGWFALSTEHIEGEGYQLRGNGRFAHSAGYLAHLAVGRFDIAVHHRSLLRREAGQAVEGGYFLLRRVT